MCAASIASAWPDPAGEDTVACADSADGSNAGTAALPLASAAPLEEAVNELAAGQLAALFATGSPVPTVPPPPLQRLLALCGQVRLMSLTVPD